MIAPTRQFDAIVAPLAGLLADDFQGEVGPLAGKQRDGTGHLGSPRNSNTDSWRRGDTRREEDNRELARQCQRFDGPPAPLSHTGFLPDGPEPRRCPLAPYS